MKIVIAGGGRIGRVLAARLVADRHAVTVIDSSREVCERVFDDVGAVTVCGDGTDARILERAGMRTAEVAAGLLPRDADNLAFATLTRSLSSARVMVRMLDDSYADAYRLAGVREIIPEADVVVAKMATAIEFPQVLSSMPLGLGDALLFEAVISPRSAAANLTVRAARELPGLPADCLFVGLVDREGHVELPTGLSVLRSGHVAIVIARRPHVAAVLACLATPVEGRAPDAALAATLRQLDFFAPLSDEELAEILRGIELMHVEAEQSIYARGASSDALYIVLTGEVELVDDGGRVHARVGPGGLFGETALMTGGTRATSARAASRCELVVVGREDFAHVAMANPAVALEMTRQLGRRLAETMQPPAKKQRTGLFGRRRNA